MDLSSLLYAVLLGILQGIFEWLPISSEGNISIILTALGESPQVAVNYALFLHLGTAIAATVYFRGEIWRLVLDVFMIPTQSYDSREVRFFLAATIVSGVTGVLLYKTLIEAVTALEGGLLIILIGILLVGTGLFQYWTAGRNVNTDPRTPYLDALIVGVGQGAAILPGISRSGTTVGLLLLRGYQGHTAFRLSFLLSIPAALGAVVLAVVESGGLPGIEPLAAVAALGASAIVGYATVDALMRLAQSVAFWAICLLLGLLAVGGGALTMI